MEPQVSVLERRQVLLIEPDQGERERFGAWLEEAGFQPINCPGPHLPGYTCLGVEGLPCALREAADVVVVDTRTLPGAAKQGTPAWRLLRYYLSAGKPVVVIAEKYRPNRSFRPEQVFSLRPNPGRESLLLAVRQLLRRARSW